MTKWPLDTSRTGQSRVFGVVALCLAAFLIGLGDRGPLSSLTGFFGAKPTPVASESEESPDVVATESVDEGREEPGPIVLAGYDQQADTEPDPFAEEVSDHSSTPPALPDMEPEPLPLPVGLETEPAALADDEAESQVRIPVNDFDGQVSISGAGDRISLLVNGAPVNEVLALIAQQHNLNVVAASEVRGDISVNLVDARLEDALDAILRVNGYTWNRQNNIILVTSTSKESTAAPGTQGQILKVFPLTWVAGDDIDTVIKGLLSPVGKSFARMTQTGDQRRTQEQVVVEDLPENVARIESYIQQTDRPPKQVSIEVHVLSVLLNDDTRHGVNFDALLELANANIRVATPGFASNAATPAFIFGIDSSDVDAVVEALQTTNDAKTLASPKVLAVNGQEARIQIGERLGYRVVTTTQTSTQEDVNFLETGIVMNVTPVIGEDGQIMMTVMPKISDGRINATTNLPEEETTDVSTTVVLRDGHAMVIGGLIDETDTEVQTKIPIAGDLWGVGRLFQRRQKLRVRREIIITLVPRVLPYNENYQAIEEQNVLRATTPLLDWPLKEFPRPFEPELPDATRHPRTIRFDRLFDSIHHLKDEKPQPAEYFFPSTQDAWYYDLYE